MARRTLPKNAVQLLVELALAVGVIVVVMVLAATLIGARAETITEWPGCPSCISTLKLTVIIITTLSAGSCIGLVTAALFAAGGRDDR